LVTEALRPTAARELQAHAGPGGVRTLLGVQALVMIACDPAAYSATESSTKMYLRMYAKFLIAPT
jgi:hypothetical protein